MNKDRKCKYYIWASLYLANVGPDSIFICNHKAWDAWRDIHDFRMPADCAGDKRKCELKRMIKRFKKFINAYEKIEGEK